MPEANPACCDVTVMRINAFQTRPSAGPAAVVGDEVTRLHSGKVPNSEFRIPNSVRAASRRLLRSWGARLLGVVASAGLAWAQGTAFSYQGQLTDGAAAANGTYDLTFSLWNAATAGAQQGATLTQNAVGVTNGLFTATLDFGAQFNGQNRWLEIAVRTNGAATFTTMAERQPVLPTPYAIHAATAGSAATATTATTVTGSVPASQLTGTLSAAQIPNLDASKITSGSFTGNGRGLTNIPLSALVQPGYPVVAWGNNFYGQTSVPDDLSGAIAISAGGGHSLALQADGTVAAWGRNEFGQTNVPGGLSGVVAIAAGNIHSLALKSDGTVVAWGYGGQGETSVPVGLSGVVAIAAGSNHSLALKSDGTIVAWGSNSVGQTNVPIGLNGVSAISAKGAHNLALKSDGTVVAWGANGFGQASVPEGLGAVVAIAAGTIHSLALKQDGTVVAWGGNVNGQAHVPVGLSGGVAIAAGSYYSLMLKSDGTVVTWGNNGSGEANVPAGLNKVTTVAGGSGHILVLKGATLNPAALARLNQDNQFHGEISALGFIGNGSGLSNLNASTLSTGMVPGARIPDLDAGKITTGTLAAARIPNLDAGKVTTGTFTAAQIPDLDAAKITSGVLSPDRIPTLDASKITSGTFTGNGRGLTNVPLSALVQSSKLVVAWGDNSEGQTNVPDGLGEVVAVAAGHSHSLALKADGTVAAWGDNANFQANVPADLGGVVAVAAGRGHSLALKSDGTVVAWGAFNFNYGQATVPPYLSGVVAISAGDVHSLALKADGTVVAWGDWSGEPGGPTAVPAALSEVVAISAGYDHSLALKADGTVVAWGGNGFGEANVPSGLSGVVAVAAGYYYSVALKADGTVVAWGFGSRTAVPAGLSGVVAIAAGWGHSLALKADGTVAAWGLSNRTNIPIGLGRGVAAVAAGGNHSLVLKNGNPASLARLDRANEFQGPISAPSFTGSGSGLTALNASALSSGTVPGARIPDLDAGKITTGTLAAARIPSLDASKVSTGTFTAAQIPNLDGAKITTGTLADARLSANMARLDGSPVFTSDVRLGDHDLFLRGGTDSNHGLGWFGGGGRTFAGATVDGPVLYGFLGGALGSTKNSAKIALSWNDSADVRLGGDLTITNSLSVSSPAGSRAASFTGTRTGDFNAAVVHVENTQTGPTAAPALRVVARGGDAEGALSVTANAGPIARFGNFATWVAKLDNSGNFSATSFITLSDRNQKAGFAPVDVDSVLAKVALLPLMTWHYTNDAAATPHLGPMAQDFHAAFGLGGDDKTIATVDADGVALAAIQGLHRKVEVLSVENAELRARLERLEALLLNRESRGN